jgi:hypothetical protein
MCERNAVNRRRSKEQAHRMAGVLAGRFAQEGTHPKPASSPIRFHALGKARQVAGC